MLKPFMLFCFLNQYVNFTFGIFVGADTEIFYQVSLNLSTLLESYPMTINYYL